jgi:hypothetical protein
VRSRENVVIIQKVVNFGTSFILNYLMFN